MLSNDTCEKLKGMGLEAFLKGVREQQQVGTYAEMPFEERLAMLIDFVYQDKQATKLKRLIKQAKFRFKDADSNSIVYPNRQLDKNQILSLLTCQFLETYTNIIITGFTGSGKTYLGCVIGKAVCRHGKSVLYIRLADLLEKMAIAGETIGGKLKLLNRLSRYNLLIIDEWASRIVRPDEAHFLFDLVEQRYGNSSTLLCTQHPIKEWHNLLGGDANADSIMDRLVQNAIHVYTGETNMRNILSPHPLRPEENH